MKRNKGSIKAIEKKEMTRKVKGFVPLGIR
jgi:hypothetical protein